ncbi:hypothetical protein [Actinobacillus pleuropneumoniae]|uniref:hypothetical protein n=1 Tax=Actinobacillus pleuropneumoniae TaxID=715 RepID=UPI001F1C8424|nr:hypothetical protein [Actinobacillus pleuropneumoniae]UKH24833.1 hypothetical protein D1107_05845 [Actinobacillus pleuropneumoniae]
MTENGDYYLFNTSTNSKKFQVRLKLFKKLAKVSFINEIKSAMSFYPFYYYSIKLDLNLPFYGEWANIFVLGKFA